MSQRASMAVAAVVLLMSVLAVSATGVSMSWFSDTESTDVDVTTGTASFIISGATESDGVYTLSEGGHTLTVTGWTVELKIDTSDGSLFLVKDDVTEQITSDREFPVGTYNLTSTGTVTLTFVLPE